MATHAPETHRTPRRGRRRLVGGGLLLLLLAAAGGVVVVRDRAAADRRDALAAAARGDFRGAEPGLLRAYDRDDRDVDAVAALAKGYLAADDLNAGPYLGRWVELRPGTSEPLRARLDYLRARKDGRALDDARALLKLDPASAPLLRSVAGLAFSYGAFEEAEGYCRQGVRDRPRDPFFKTLLAETRRARGDSAEAARLMDELIAESPTGAGPLLGRATLHQEAGEWAQSVPLLRAVYDTSPSQRRAAGYLLAQALDRTGKRDEARAVTAEVRRLQDVDVFDGAMRNQPDNLDLRVRFATTLLADGHTADGLNLLAAVLERDPFFRPAHAALAAHYDQQGPPDRAAGHRRLAGP